MAASSESVETTSGIHARELPDQFGVIETHAHQRVHLRPGEGLQRLVIVALVGPAGDPHHGARHALQRIVNRIDVGGLRVVDPQHAVLFRHGFEPVFDGREGVERFADLRRGDAAARVARAAAMAL